MHNSSRKKVIRVSTVPMSLYLLLEGQLKFLNQHFDVIGVSSSGDYLNQVKRREEVHVHPIEIKRAISPINDLVSLYKLYRYFKLEKPDIVHSITPKAGLLSMIAAFLANTPYRLHTFTGLIFPSKRGIVKQILIFMDRILCRCATNIYPEGKGVKNDLIRYNITKKPLNIIANGNVNGVDVDFFSPLNFDDKFYLDLRNRYNIDQNDIVFVFVGRLVKDKGINELVEAFSSFNRERSKSKLFLVGDFENDLGPLKVDTITEIENNENIIAVGFQIDIRPFLFISDIFTFPSYREGFPNVVLQACSMGLPCIVTDISGSNEIIENGVNGLVIKSESKTDLLQSMKDTSSGLFDLELMGKNARAKVIRQYNRPVVWKSLLEEYQNLK